MSKIEWTDATWNPIIGCSKVSAGCKNCYAEVMARRLQSMGIEAYKEGFKLKLMPDRLEEPLRKKKPTMYFVNSMSDLFHEKVPFEYIDKIMGIIEKTPHHKYQILTKRALIMKEYFKDKKVLPNIWLGVTVENKKSGLPRIDILRGIESKIRFLSIEPLLEDLGDINLEGIHWAIVGGESGYNARPMKEEWVLNIKKKCEEYNTAFFFKQWGTWGSDNKRRSKKENGRLLQGNIYDNYPEDIF